MDKNAKMWVVYVHTVPKEITNYPHDKYYVGITCNCKERWRKDGLGYKKLSSTGRYPLFWYAIQKYGWENIHHEILKDGLSLKRAFEEEKYYIRLFKSNLREYGYNQTNGGDGSCGAPVTEKQRKARSENMKLLAKDKEVVAKRIEGFRQASKMESYRKKQSLKAKKLWLDEEYRKKCTGSKCHFSRDKYIFKGGDSVLAKKVVCLNTGEVFDAATIAQDKYNAKNISKCCKGKALSSGKKDGVCLTWLLYEDYVNASEKDIQDKIHKANAERFRNQMKVINLNSKIVYKSQVQAAEICHVSNSYISNDCKTKHKEWMKYSEYCLINGTDNDVVFME